MYKRSPRMDKDLFNDDAAVVWPVFFGSRPNSAPGLDVYSVPRPAFLIDSINSSGAGRGKYRTDIRIDSPLLEFEGTEGSIGRSTDDPFQIFFKIGLQDWRIEMDIR